MTEGEFQEFLIKVGYRYNKKSKTAFNSFEGFHTLICFLEKEKRYHVQLDAFADDKPALEKMLRDFSSEGKDYVTKAVCKNRIIEISIKMTVDSQIDREHLEQLARFMTTLYKSGTIRPLCRVCGRGRKTGLYVIGQELTPVCENCITRKRRLYERRVDLFEKKQQNMPAGIAGALFGAMLGASLYVLLYQLWTGLGIYAALIMLGAFAGFVAAGNRATKKSAVVCYILSVIVFIITEYTAIVTALAIQIEREGGGIAVAEAMQVTNTYLTDTAYLSYIWTIFLELGIGIAVMALIGLGYYLKRRYTRPLKISKNVL